MRTSHTVRPIRRSALLTARRIPQGDDWSAVTTGLLAAGHLRALFPDFYAAHVAHLPTTPRALLGIVQAFFSLAQQKVELQIADEITTDPLHPCAVLNLGDDLDDALACDLIAQSAGHDVHEIWPVVYGLDLDHEELFGFGVAPPLVAVLCWVLAAETAWALPFCAVDELIPAIQRQLYQCRIDPAILARLDSLPRIPPDTPMEALCDALDAQPLVHGGTLGAIIRYVCHATGNQFADLSPASSRRWIARTSTGAPKILTRSAGSSARRSRSQPSTRSSTTPRCAIAPSSRPSSRRLPQPPQRSFQAP
ncbi:MAG: hypothetical protein WCF99_00960 [Chloroflexales bacterium]